MVDRRSADPQVIGLGVGAKRMAGFSRLSLERAPEFGHVLVVRSNEVPAQCFREVTAPSLSPVGGRRAVVQLRDRREKTRRESRR